MDYKHAVQRDCYSYAFFVIFNIYINFDLFRVDWNLKLVAGGENASETIVTYFLTLKIIMSFKGGNSFVLINSSNSL
jgi:hypothetical protein